MAATQAAVQPAEPGWRRPPPKPREKLRVKQTTLEPANKAEAHRWLPGGVTPARSVSPPTPAPTPGPHGAAGAGAQPGRALLHLSLPRLPGGVLWRLGTGLLILLTAVAAMRMLLTNDLFVVRSASAEIRGNQRVPSGLIYGVSEVDQHNIFTLKPGELERRVESIPGIQEAIVHVRLPNEILIDVNEQAPLVAWQAITNTMWVAEDGTLVPLTGDPPPLQLIDVTGAAIEAKGVPSSPGADPAARRSRAPGGSVMRRKVLENLATLHGLRPDITELYYGKLEGLYFRSPEGWTVYLGDDGQIPRKMALLEATRKEIAARNLQVQSVDLRFEFEGLAALK